MNAFPQLAQPQERLLAHPIFGAVDDLARLRLFNAPALQKPITPPNTKRTESIDAPSLNGEVPSATSSSNR